MEEDEIEWEQVRVRVRVRVRVKMEEDEIEWEQVILFHGGHANPNPNPNLQENLFDEGLSAVNPRQQIPERALDVQDEEEEAATGTPDGVSRRRRNHDRDGL